MLIGIYKYTNKINGKIYIGQSIDIKKRQCTYKSSANNQNSSGYNTPFHQAIREYGLENFNFEIVIELSPFEYTKEKLDELEQYFIEYYNSFNNGYNATKGGEYNFSRPQVGEKKWKSLVDPERC